jgi:hypothetical protein
MRTMVETKILKSNNQEEIEMKKNSCESRIDKELNSRIKDFAKVLARFDAHGYIRIDGYKYEDFIEWLNEYALAYDPNYEKENGEIAKRLELSYGGPQDYFLFHQNGDITYHFLDWFDGAKRYLHNHDLEIMGKVKDWLDF